MLLPIVLIALAILGAGRAPSTADGERRAVDLFLLGPGAGVAVGLLAVAALDLIRRRTGIPREYEALYALGVALTAYAAAEALHDSEFLAAVAAGLTITALDVELCDCFEEYGRITAEMALLFTFVLFGGSLIWSGFALLDGPTLLFALVALAARPVVVFLALAGSGLDRRARLLLAWFGPRGLSSLLLVLLAVFAGAPGAERLFARCALVVVCSIVLHGGTPIVLALAHPERPGGSSGTPLATRRAARRQPAGPAGPAPPREPFPLPVLDRPEPPADGLGADDGARISLEELRALWQQGEPVILLDVRTERTYGQSDRRAQGALRLPPDHIAERAAELGLPRQAWLGAYRT